MAAISSKRIVIIGGCGFIGHNLAISLKKSGYEVEVLDSLQVNNLGYYSSTYIENKNSERYITFIEERLRLLRELKIPIHVIDARDYHSVSKKLTEIEPSTIFHLAAVSHANRSNKDPFSTYDHSLRTLENVLDCNRSINAHFIYFSSSMVYGNFNGKEVTEDQVCNPMGIYGALKLAGEIIVKSYEQVFDMNYTIVRPSALYGERCVSRRVGQAFIENALVGQNLSINGDGTDSLDFTYIDDLIQGVSKCINNEKALNETFNITYGSGRTIKELANIVLKEFSDIELNINPRDELMPERGTLSIEKAKRLLNYKPTYPIEDGFRSYIDWYKAIHKSHPQVFLS